MVSENGIKARHFLIDIYATAELLDDGPFIEQTVRKACAEACVTLLQYHSQSFHNGGLSAFALLAESHLSVHTWPELNYAAMDLFTCGRQAKPEAAIDVIRTCFTTGEVTTRELQRGINSAQR